MKDDRLYLLHVRDACTRILDYCRSGEAHFRTETMIQDAIIRNFQIIGEAVKKVSPELKERTPQLHWRAIAGMRDKLVHGYFDVDLQVVWESATLSVPALLPQIIELIEQLGGEDLTVNKDSPSA